MATYDYFWKVYLYANNLQPQAKNYVARVAYNSTLYPADLARLIWQEGSEVREETILAILGRSESLIRQKVSAGHRVVMNNYLMEPVVRGCWDTPGSPFDPRKHDCMISLNPTVDMKRELKHISVEVLGLRNQTRVGITGVTDAATGKTNGQITSGDDIVLEGECLKVTVDDPDAGVFFVSVTNGTEHRVTRRLTRNFPTSVIARVPAGLAPGEYRVVIRTRFTPGGTTIQKQLQEIEYHLPLQILEDG